MQSYSFTNRRGNVTPLQHDEDDPNNAVNYSGSDEDYLGAFEAITISRKTLNETISR